MSYPLPEGEDLRRAVKWISAGLENPSHEPIPRLVEQAIFKFDLSPKDGELLLDFLRGASSHHEPDKK